MTDFALSLSTVLTPTKKFKVDGVPYDLLGIDHLSSEEEAEVMALFARYESLQDELSGQKNTDRGKVTATHMRATRISILTKLTTLPKDVANKLPLTAQVRLLETVQAETEANEEDTPVEDAPGAEAEG